MCFLRLCFSIYVKFLDKYWQNVPFINMKHPFNGFCWGCASIVYCHLLFFFPHLLITSLMTFGLSLSFCLKCSFIYLFVPMACGDSWARDWILSPSCGLRSSFGNIGSLLYWAGLGNWTWDSAATWAWSWILHLLRQSRNSQNLLFSK